MASTYTDLGIEKMATGENAGTWGTKTNTNLDIIEKAISGYVEQAVTSGGTTQLTITDGDATESTSVARHAVIKLTGTITGNSIVTVPDSVEKVYIVTNGTSGAYTVQFKTASGTGITFGVSEKTTRLVYSDGTNIVDAGFGGALDIEGRELVLDADGDTTITADTDDQIDIKIAGADDFQFTANTFTAQAGSTIAAQALTATTVTASGIVKTDDTTEATSTTDGSLQTDGGLSVAKDAVIGDDLKLLSDSAVLSFGADSDITVTHAADTGLTTNGTFQATTITATTAVVPDASDGATLGTSALEWSDLYIADGGIIYFGDDQEITLTHAADDGLILKHVGTADGKEPSLTFQAGDTDIAADDVLGSIFFQAPDEGAGTDAILVAAGIEAVSEGDFSSSNNATKLSFKTGASEAATEKVTISSAGNLNLVSSNTELRFYEGSNYVGFEAPALSGNQIWVLPTADGSSGQQLTTDGSGTLSWAAATSATAADDISTGDAAVTIATSSGNITLDAQAGDTDIIFKGTDSSSDITALTLDMSDAGSAIFNNDVSLDSDSAVLKFGDDQDTTLTHTDGTGLTLNGTNKLCFYDTALSISSSTDGQLDIDADTEVEITATTVDVNGILDVSGVIVAGGQISAADGTAGAPSISNTGDLNSGLYFSAADTLAFSAGGTAQFTMADGVIAPVTDNDVDLGTASLEFKDGYFDGTLYCDTLNLNGTDHTSIEDPTALAIALG